MKRSTLIIMAVAALVAQLIGIQPLGAQQFFKASVNAVGVSTNHAGQFTQHPLRNHDLILQCAMEKGLTNLTGLSLVYNRTADAVEVVSGTNHTLVCTALTFANGTWLMNTNGTKVQRLAWVYWETNTTANGTLLATERYAYGPTNQLVFFSLNGQLQFAVPAAGTNGPVIYRGSIAAGSDFDDFEGEDSEDRD